jgi:L-alanine-DL-glutamate epimerase-like enolase superfamily enzyme
VLDLLARRADVPLAALLGAPLRASVPGVLELSFGKNFTARGREFTHALLVKLADKAALDGYAAHPAHVRVVEELLAPIRADVLAVDYEC